MRQIGAVRHLATLWIALLAGALGCAGSAGPATGDVSGKVTFEGKPVEEGIVSFMNSDTGTGGEANLAKDGTFSLSSPLPVGEYKVAVMPITVRMQEGGKGPEVGVEKPAPDIPNKYRTTGSTDLKATVEAGKNDFQFGMKR